MIINEELMVSNVNALDYKTWFGLRVYCTQDSTAEKNCSLKLKYSVNL
jgi:hypothetical protein